MQHSSEGRPDTTATLLQPGFLASVFRDLGAEVPEQGTAPPQEGAGPGADAGPVRDAGQEQPPGQDEEVAAHGRAAALAHHRTVTVRAGHERLADLLRRAALPVSAMDFESQLRSYEPRPYPAGEPDPQTGPEPRWADFAPPEPAADDPDRPASRLLLDSGYQRGLAQARLSHQRALREWRTRQAEADDSGARQARLAHEQAEQSRARAVREYNETLKECRRAYRQSEPAAVESLLERALAAAEGATQDLPAPCRAVFRPLTSTAVLDLDLPPLDVVPELDGYRLGAGGEVEPVPRPAADRAADYLRLAARLALRALQAADAVDTEEILAGVVLNGWLRSDAPGAGPLCLLSVDADRDALARTRLLPAEDGGAAGPAEAGDGMGVYADAEQDEALVRLRELAAVVTPDPYGPVEVEPSGTVGAAVPAAEELSSNEFAHLVRELLTKGGLVGWNVRLRGPAGLVATGEGGPGSALPGRWVVWASREPGAVGEEQLRTLAEAVREEGAERGLRLTTGRFTEPALDLTAGARYEHIHLIDGRGVQELARTHLGLPLTTDG
ncbi:restriction endonuclease [Kitasatospora sp. NPDC048540]|uniref:restriction endonuclease n=1 Tax=unclassified Kitasatospora TaxID=2633591 RepID=UPI00053A24F5|nr:restriction endonuclease [Kitasatospora sp. MBT63]